MIFGVLRLTAKIFLVTIVILVVISYFFAIVLGPALFYFTPEGLNTSILHLQSLQLWFLNISVRLPTEVDLGTVFFGLWTIFALSFGAAWKLRDNFSNVIKKSFIQPTRKLFNNCLFAMPILNSITFIAVAVINSIQEAGGIPTGTPPLEGEPFLNFFDLSYATVVEELGFRIIPIGTFILVYLIATKRKETFLSYREYLTLFFTSFLLPNKAKRVAGAKTINEHGILGGISIGEWGMLILTSLIFGFAHFNPGVSWEIGKISSAGFAGLVIGSSFLIYGAHAAIIMHWFFNVYTQTYSLLSDFHTALTPLVSTLTVFTLILGVLGTVTLSTLGHHKLKEILRKEV